MGTLILCFKRECVLGTRRAARNDNRRYFQRDNRFVDRPEVNRGYGVGLHRIQQLISLQFFRKSRESGGGREQCRPVSC